jgi:hypothetical protein
LLEAAQQKRRRLRLRLRLRLTRLRLRLRLTRLMRLTMVNDHHVLIRIGHEHGGI